MRLTVLGSSGTYPLPGRPASGHLVSSGAKTALLDLGPGVFMPLTERGMIPDVIVLSHRHPDHCLDLLPLFNYLRFDRPDDRGIPVLAPGGVADAFAEFLGAGGDHDFFRVFDHRTVEPGSEANVSGFNFQFGAATHPVPAVVTRVSDGTHSLAYSGDTGPGSDLVRVAQDVDLLLCEATDQGTPGPDRYPFHLAASEAGSIAKEARAGALVLTHVAPRLDPNVSIAEASAVFDGSVRHAEPGLEVDL